MWDWKYREIESNNFLITLSLAFPRNFKHLFEQDPLKCVKAISMVFVCVVLNFHRLCPLGRVGHRVAMSICKYVCLSVIKVVIVDNVQSIRFLSSFIK